jgi:virulence-associated protein VapD
MPGSKRFKAINFDLDTQCLRDRFGESGRRKAYSDIGRFLKDNSFEYRQGSGYRSTTTMSDPDIIDLIILMYTTFDWLPDCVQKLDVTNIGKEYDLDTIAKRRINAVKKSVYATPFDVEL